ncbi:M20 family metallopeptidase [Apibacter sp. HY039]|uniref:M20 metallopeptidase family protein n=1 Tax=Apibacter sp. HY039 TaxID=2501476 RepID=UPI001C86F3BC|nr:amidohydrolase [Apibacter sp. HY039]
MKKLILLTLSVLSQYGFGQDNTLWQNSIPMTKVIEWRRHIHQNPELSFQENKTSKYVADVLKSFGNIQVKQITKTSVIGILKGNSPGKTVAFRADMDALPIQEETGLPYASVNANVSHACGHDSHTAMLLGTAYTLSKMQKNLKGTVIFIFQHAEEKIPGGALDMIKTGELDSIEAFFGLHVMPLPVGIIGILPNGPASTASDSFFLTITGKSSHGSMPHLGVDPIVTGAELVNNLQTIVSRNVQPGNLAVLTVGKFQSGNAPNVIPERAELAATIRTTDPETRKLMETRIKSIVENTIKTNNASYQLDYVLGYPPIYNDEKLNALAKASAIKATGLDNVVDSPSITASEDFSYYKKIAPVCFVLLGVGNDAVNHNSKFTIDESAFLNGIKTEVQIILDFLNQ